MAAVEQIVNRHPDRDHTIDTLVCAVFDPDMAGDAPPTRAQVESVRRACKRLAALGRVELRHSHESRGRAFTGIPGTGLWTMERTYVLVRARRTTPD